MHLLIRTTDPMYIYAVDTATEELVVVGELAPLTHLEIAIEPLIPTIMRCFGAETAAARIVHSDDAHPGYILLQELCRDAQRHGYAFICARYAAVREIGLDEANRRMTEAYARLYQLAYDRRRARLRVA